MTTNTDFSKIADEVLKIAALVGVAAAVLTIGYNHYLCTRGSIQVVFSIPVVLLAIVIFSISLGLSDKVFGTFRNLDIWSGPLPKRFFMLIIYLSGYLAEVSFGVVATHAFMATGNIPNCVS